MVNVKISHRARRDATPTYAFGTERKRRQMRAKLKRNAAYTNLEIVTNLNGTHSPPKHCFQQVENFFTRISTQRMQ